ncbi:MAG: hypothetical protein C0506_14835 [Anaerolinea sp.]|nr:hypothetical protein [Anaerolinea sp.]
MGGMTQIREPVAALEYPPMTYVEYINDPRIPERTEWVDGRVFPMMSVSRKHAQLTSYLIMVLGVYVSHRRLGNVYHDPFNMKLGGELPGRAPDVLFVRSAHLDRVRGQFLDGPADLVIEVVRA